MKLTWSEDPRCPGGTEDHALRRLGWIRLSEPARLSALEVLAANHVAVMVDDQDGVTQTPVVSHAILSYNRGRTKGLADGIAA